MNFNNNYQSLKKKIIYKKIFKNKLFNLFLMKNKYMIDKRLKNISKHAFTIIKKNKKMQKAMQE